MLLTADAEADVAVDPGPIDVLKVAHHGSDDPGLERPARPRGARAGGGLGRRRQPLRAPDAGHARDPRGTRRAGAAYGPRRDGRDRRGVARLVGAAQRLTVMVRSGRTDRVAHGVGNPTASGATPGTRRPSNPRNRRSSSPNRRSSHLRRSLHSSLRPAATPTAAAATPAGPPPPPPPAGSSATRAIQGVGRPPSAWRRPRAAPRVRRRGDDRRDGRHQRHAAMRRPGWDRVVSPRAPVRSHDRLLRRRPGEEDRGGGLGFAGGAVGAIAASWRLRSRSRVATDGG